MSDADDKKSIKYYIKNYLYDNASVFKGKSIIDFPAGNGVTSKIIQDIGATPLAFDLFPEYFKVDDIECKQSNIEDGIPIDKSTGDALICQEGIEHFPNQLQALQEFNRVLKKEGKLLITTPNYSNLKSRFSYLVSESEKAPSYMPPNELDSVWMSDPAISKEVYYGHIFLIGAQKLRVLAKLSGFKLKKVHYTTMKLSNLFLFILFYPTILISNWWTYQKAIAKKNSISSELKRKVYKEQFLLNISPTVLLSRHLIVEFTKEQELDEVKQTMQSVHQEFGKT